MPQRILALEVDAQEMRAAVVETTFRDYKVTGFFSAPTVSGDGSPAEQLRAFVDRHDLAGATVVSALPGDMVSLRTFFLPFRDRKRLDQTVPFELETQVPFGLDDVIVDYSVLHRDKAGSVVLAALAQRSDLEQHLALLREAGLDPKIVDLEPLATLNVLRLLGDELPSTFIYIGGSYRRCTVALFRNGHLVGLRTAVPVVAAATPAEPRGAGNGHSVVHTTRVEALASEIRWTLLALNGAPLENELPCFVGGDSVEFRQLEPWLADELGCAVRRLDAAPLRAVPPALRSELESFAPLLGLALREAAPTDALGVNFRQGEFAYHRGQDEVRRALWRTGALAALVVALAITDTFLGYQQLAGRLATIQAQIRQVFMQTLPGVQRVVDEKMQLQAEIDAAHRRLQLLGGVSAGSGATAIDVMRVIAAALPENLRIDIDDYVMDTDGVRIKANADSFEAADTIKQQIAATKYFSEVEVKDVKAAPDGKGVDFRLIVQLPKDPVGAPKP